MSSKNVHLVILFSLVGLTTTIVAQDKPPCAEPKYSHGIAHLLPVKYGTEFTHFDYANPNAPKMGEMRLPSLGRLFTGQVARFREWK